MLFAATDDSGLEPVRPERRLHGLFDNAVLWADLGVSFLVMIVGTFLVPGLGLPEALLAILIGAVIGNALLGLGAAIGSDVGLPTMVLLRGPLGRAGSYAPTALNVLQLVGWATFEVIVMAQAADVLASRVLSLPSAYALWVLVFTVLTAAMALAGPVAVTRVLKRVVVWAVLASTVWLTVAIATSYDLGALLARPGTGAMSFWLAVDLVIALPVSWFPLVADYSRFSRTRGAAFWGTSVGYFIPHVWFYAIGATLALAAGVAFDPNAPIAPLLGAIAGLTAGWLALLVILIDETDESFANVYSTAVSARNLLPTASQRMLVLGVSLVVLIVALTVPLTQYESFLLLIGGFFVPLLGVLAADYYGRAGGRYTPDALLGAPAVRWAGLGGWAVGVLTYFGIAGLPALGVAGLAPALGASLPSFIVAFAAQSALVRLEQRSPLSPEPR